MLPLLLPPTTLRLSSLPLLPGGLRSCLLLLLLLLDPAGGRGEGTTQLLLLSCWCAHIEAYSPPAATRVAWLPLSTTCPLASTRIWSASIMVLSLCATMTWDQHTKGTGSIGVSHCLVKLTPHHEITP